LNACDDGSFDTLPEFEPEAVKDLLQGGFALALRASQGADGATFRVVGVKAIAVKRLEPL